MPRSSNCWSPRSGSAFNVVSILLAVLACDSGEREQQALDGPVGAPIGIAPTPVVSVGVVSGDVDQEFDRVVTPFLSADGRLVVPDAGASTIRVFDERGELLHVLGRQGAGPGEFRSLTAAWPRGDTIEALDARLSRITRFGPDGSVETIDLRSEVRDLSAVGGPITDGWIAGGVALGDVGRRDSIVLRRFDRTGADSGQVASIEGFARYRTAFLTGPEPLSPRASLQVSEGRVYVAETTTPRIRVLTGDGTLDREITWQPEVVHSGRDVISTVIDSAVARENPERGQALRQHLESAIAPERTSVFWKFIVDPNGFVWIRPFEPLKHAAALGGLSLPGGGLGGRWSVLSLDGNVVLTITVPDDLEILQVTTDAVVGISRDEFGVESVRVHQLVRR